MARITNEVKAFIVRALAWGDGLAQIIRAVKDDFDLVVTKQQVAFYDPRVGEKPGEQWVALFNAERGKAQTALDDLPLAGVPARVRLRSRWVNQLDGKGNVVKANEILGDIARDVGGMFTNRRELTGKDGQPLLGSRPVSDMSDEELAAIGAALISSQRPATAIGPVGESDAIANGHGDPTASR